MLLYTGHHLMRGNLRLFRRAIVLGATALCSTDLTPRNFDATLEGWRRILLERSELNYSFFRLGRMNIHSATGLGSSSHSGSYLETREYTCAVEKTNGQWRRWAI